MRYCGRTQEGNIKSIEVLLPLVQPLGVWVNDADTFDLVLAFLLVLSDKS